MIGETFNKLTVSHFAAQDYYWSDKHNKLWKGHKWYYCNCECGNYIIARGYSLKTNNTKSCGCLLTTHGLSYTPEWQTWIGMKGRCLNTNHVDYPNYGGRGIEVCTDWILSIENFVNDMGKRPDGHTLDRIDVNGNYCPENCQWATYAHQTFNRRPWSNRQKKLKKLLHRRVSKE